MRNRGLELAATEYEADVGVRQRELRVQRIAHIKGSVDIIQGRLKNWKYAVKWLDQAALDVVADKADSGFDEAVEQYNIHIRALADELAKLLGCRLVPAAADGMLSESPFGVQEHCLGCGAKNSFTPADSEYRICTACGYRKPIV